MPSAWHSQRFQQMGWECSEHETQSLGQLWENWRLALSAWELEADARGAHPGEPG